MKVAAFLPAKGASERVFNKNVALLDGKPLFLHLLERLCQSRRIDEVWLDTESDAVWALADHLPVRRLKRDPALATNATDGHALFMNEVRHVEADVYVQALGTSPFLKLSTIEAAIAAVTEGPYDSCLAVREERQYEWRDGAPVYGFDRIPNSFELQPTVKEAMCLYAVRREAALEWGQRYGRRPKLLPVDATEAVDVNTPEDFELANLIAAGLRERDRVHLRSIHALLSSSLVSDTLEDFGIRGLIRGLQANLPDTKIVGRASTVKLRPLHEGEDFRGIYDALNSYDRLVPDDVICVENGAAEYAYFGELNARLALRRGAAGMVTNGATRDSAAVRALGFPTFAGGRSAADVRGRATLESLGKPIEILGVPVRNGDLIVADSDGVCVVPRARESEVLNALHQRLRAEHGVALDIAMGAREATLVDRHGAF